jgi:hypothetical protein
VELYHGEKSVPAGISTFDDVPSAPAPVPVKIKLACVTSLVFEYPLIFTSTRPLLLLLNKTLVITGAAGAITNVVGANPVGVTSTPPVVNFSVTVIVPAIVPVCNAAWVDAVVDAGMVKVAVRPPVAN